MTLRPDGGITSTKTGQLVKSPVAKVAVSNQNLVQLLQQAGFRGSGLQTMFKIIMAESGGRAGAHNGNAGTGDNSYGLAQINMLGQMGVNRAKQYGLTNYNQLFDPLTNLKAAYKISGGGTNFSPWTTYTSGRYAGEAYNPNFQVNLTKPSYTGVSNSGLGTNNTGTTQPANPALNESLAQYLGTDTLYQQQRASEQKQLAEYLGGQQQAKANELAKYGNQVHTLGEQNTQNLDKDLNSYGARGLAHSSLYGDSLTSIGQQYNAKKSALDTANSQFLANLAQGTRAFQDQQLNASQQALADAAARRASGITTDYTGVAIPGQAKSAIGAVNPNIKGSK